MTHPNLTAALVEFHKEVPKLKKSATNPHFHSQFVPLDEVVEKAVPVLCKHGLTFMAFPSVRDGSPTLRYALSHTSGESVEGQMPLCIGDKVTPQAQGSAITYARRYAMMSVLGLVGDDDDDGNAGSNGNGAAAASTAKMSPAIRKALIAELDNRSDAGILLAAAGVSGRSNEWAAADEAKIRTAIESATP